MQNKKADKKQAVKPDVKKQSNKLVVHKVTPVITPVLRNHNKTILGLVHVIVCQLLGIDALSINSLIIYATITSVYTSKMVNSNDNDKIDIIKDTSFDGKNLNKKIAFDAVNVLNGNASKNTMGKFKGSVKKLHADISVIADYFTYFCDSKSIDKKQAITQARKSNAIKDSAYNNTIMQALNAVKTA